MLIKKPADLRYSDITPRSVYLNRRKFLAGLPAALVAGREALSPSGRARAASGRFPNLAKSPFSTTEKVNSYNDVTHYNNFYEFGTQKDEPAKLAQDFKTGPLDGLGGRRRGQAAQILHGRIDRSRAPGRAHLPAPLRGSVVDRGALGGLLPERAAETGEAHGQSQVRGLRNLLQRQHDARPEGRHRISLCGGPAPG